VTAASEGRHLSLDNRVKRDMGSKEKLQYICASLVFLATVGLVTFVPAAPSANNNGAPHAPWAFFRAAQRNDTATLGNLLGRNVDVNSVNAQNETALMIAVSNGRVEAANLLLSQGANPNIVSREPEGATALHYAASNDSAPLVASLLAKGADPNARAKGLRNLTPLGTAAGALVNGGTDGTAVAKLLVEHGAKVDALDEGGVTPLLRASVDAKPPHLIAEYLLVQGANPNIMDAQGRTPLIAASEWKDAHFAKALLSKGADWRNSLKQGIYALDYAARGAPEIAQMLLDRGADPNKDASEMGTPIFNAVMFGDKRCVEILLKHGAVLDKSKAVKYVNRLNDLIQRHSPRQAFRVPLWQENADFLEQYIASLPSKIKAAE
jgi:ankyrin repeat protein